MKFSRNGMKQIALVSSGGGLNFRKVTESYKKEHDYLVVFHGAYALIFKPA